jgi:hypothetical protein
VRALLRRFSQATANAADSFACEFRGPDLFARTSISNFGKRMGANELIGEERLVTMNRVAGSAGVSPASNRTNSSFPLSRTLLGNFLE